MWGLQFVIGGSCKKGPGRSCFFESQACDRSLFGEGKEPKLVSTLPCSPDALRHTQSLLHRKGAPAKCLALGRGRDHVGPQWAPP